MAGLLALPTFDFAPEVEQLAELHGSGTLEHLQAIIDAKLLSKDAACRRWAESLGFAHVDVLASIVTEEALALLPLEIARKVHAIGLYVINGVLTIAMATPQDAVLRRRLEQITQVPISPVFAPPPDIDVAIAIHYSTEKTLAETLAGLEHSQVLRQAGGNAEEMSRFVESVPLSRVLDELIFFALRERTTDIHIEPQEMETRVRFRVDGNLRQVLTLSRKLHRALLSRMKLLCGLNIAETRVPQDGRFSMPVGTAKAEFRFSSIPTVHGEKAVLRILTASVRKAAVSLDGMLMSQNVLQAFRRLIHNSNGIIFVTGPTGSGKTTTLYSALDEINRPDVNLSTIEDPVEITLPGLTQSQVNPAADLKFSTMLRALLRQDPDVIVVGEIRDVETAKIAAEAALTGHLVFATLHTNTAPQAIVRLMEIGVEPYMVAPSVIGVLAQRLAARICEKCKESYIPSRDVLLRYFQEEGLTEVPFYRGRGCPHCRNTGYRGRIAFHELVLVTDEIRELIVQRRGVPEIGRAAAKVGYRPLRYDGLKKVLLGLTTIEEIEQNSSFEWAC